MIIRLMCHVARRLSVSWVDMTSNTSVDGTIHQETGLENPAFAAYMAHDGDPATFWLENAAIHATLRMTFDTPRRAYATTLTNVDGTPGGDRPILTGSAIWGRQVSDGTFVLLLTTLGDIKNTTSTLNLTSSPLCDAYELRTVGTNTLGAAVYEWDLSFRRT